MKIIGLTGPTGAGKGCCGDFFRENGIPCLDTDKIYHELLIPPSPCADELFDYFGNRIRMPDGSVDRTLLSSIVFSDQSGDSLEKLNHITHKYVSKETQSRIEQYRNENKTAVVIDAPLLFEASFDAFCDFCIAVLADRVLRIKRIMIRDGISEERALSRILSQKSDEFYSSRAEHTVWNNGNIAELQQALRRIMNEENVSFDTQ